uniref:Dematin n=1 Tax=Callorhinchus milii TaxID=7868 RepID=V9KNX2_CALMI
MENQRGRGSHRQACSKHVRRDLRIPGGYSASSPAKNMQKQTLTSPGTVSSKRTSSTPGSPSTPICAKMDDQVLGYRTLAAIPTDKAILDIERPDLMIYQPHYSYCPPELQGGAEHSLSPRPRSPLTSPEVCKENRDCAEERSGSRQCYPLNTALPQHFHTPDNGTNIYRKRPIYRLSEPLISLPQSKYIEDLIIESSRFPAAQAPDPTQPAKIETESWPCPPSLAVLEKESRRRAALRDAEDEEDEDDEDETDEMSRLREMQRQELNKIQCGLGKMILREELTRSKARGRKSRSLPDRTTRNVSPHSSAMKSPSLPVHGRNCLYRLQSADFTPTPREADPGGPGLQNGEGQRGRMDRGTSLPTMLEHKIYPYDSLKGANRARLHLPPGVDRTHLERHLSPVEFQGLFEMTIKAFDKLPRWRRTELKRRVDLF